MNEAKTLVHLSVSAMIAALFVGLAVGLITLGYFVWGMFSNQDLANRRMKDYAKYAAYDNTIIRGQDAVSLIASTEGDPFVIVMKGDNSSNNYDHWEENIKDSNYWTIYYNNLTETATLTHKDNYYSVPCLDSGYDYTDIGFQKLTYSVDGTTAKPIIPSESCSVFNFSDATIPHGYKDIQNSLLSRTPYIKNDSGPVTGYATYHSVLIYDSGTSTDVIGVLLVEQKPKTID